MRLAALEFVGEYVAHRVGGAPRRSIVVVGVPLKRERGRRVSGEGLEIPYRLPALGKQGEATMPEIMEPYRGETYPFE